MTAFLEAIGLKAFLEALGLKYVPLGAGFIGALISLKFIEGLGIWSRASTVLAGAVIAAYCTPLTVYALSISPKLEAPVAFLGGLLGMAIAGAFIKAIPEWLAAARSKFLGGGS